MNRCRHRAFLLMSIIAVAVGLFLLLPFLSILEILTVAFIILCLVLAISEVDDRLHLHRTRQHHRQLTLQRLRQRPPFDRGH